MIFEDVVSFCPFWEGRERRRGWNLTAWPQEGIKYLSICISVPMQSQCGEDRGQLCHRMSVHIYLFVVLIVLLQVEMKSHPHPERPDRLRAIVASLSTAGMSSKYSTVASLGLFLSFLYVS